MFLFIGCTFQFAQRERLQRLVMYKMILILIGILSVLYWIAQLLGSVVACLLLKFATGGLETSAFALVIVFKSAEKLFDYVLMLILFIKQSVWGRFSPLGYPG
ncbi:hypothetical protein QVD17_22658 [Tagetes erecta]|uniref:Uncharacterized protein n=1 Tax=Tagetes erecta TaxID=13708 RepID=A0AAD8KI39_TARER|nr:hypothetical protein QVD17_22658 [Tagetes erecta]